MESAVFARPVRPDSGKMGGVFGRLIALVLVAAGCRATPDEPAPAATRPGARRPETHRVVERDHRHVIEMHEGDRIALPDDHDFDWRAELEDPSGFVRDGADAYRLTKAGPFRMMFYGEPKCLRTDAGCGLSRRRWDVTVDVR
jgi:hypothetical protein